MRLPKSSSLRWRIAIMFMVLSSAVYLTLTILATWLFHAMLIKTMDNELRYFASSIGHGIGMRNGKPFFRDWMRVVKTEPERSIITIQLYDAHGVLLEEYGTKRFEKLLYKISSVRWGKSVLRTRTNELTHDGQLVGYLQLELPTDAAEANVRHFALTMALIAPLVIAGLTITSLIVSRQVVNPFIESMNMLTRFVADASHELNTPLSIMQARVESMRKKLGGSVDKPLSAEDFSSLERSLERMSSIVRDLTLLVQVEGPLATTPKSQVDLGEVVTRLVEDMRPRFIAKEIELSYEQPESSIVVQGYADALQRLVSNLLENALKYTESGGKVTVSLNREDRFVRMVVADTGIGIPADNIPFIFNRFYRVDSSRSRQSGGIGLGLAIVKAIAEAHGGTVSVHSEPGKGSQFVFITPLH